MASKKLSVKVLMWLSVWCRVQIMCIWSSWCHCHLIISCLISEGSIYSIFLVLAYVCCPGKEDTKWVFFLSPLVLNKNMCFLSGQSSEFRILPSVFQHKLTYQFNHDRFSSTQLYSSTFTHQVLLPYVKHIFCLSILIRIFCQNSKNFFHTLLIPASLLHIFHLTENWCGSG